MAYMNAEKKALIKTELDKVMKGTGVKWSLAVRHHSTIVMNIKSGPIDFIGNYNKLIIEGRRSQGNGIGNDNPPNVSGHIQVNTYHYDKHFTGDALDLLNKIMACLNAGNYDNSDSQRDYFDCGWYVDVNIGKWDKQYEYTGTK